MYLLKIKNLSKTYKNNLVLDNINLYLKKGSTLGVIGPTGCGKTTLLRIIDLIEKPSSGNIFFDNIDTSKSEIKKMEIRRRIGMVFQKPMVFKESVYDNISYGLKIRGENEEHYQDKIEYLLGSLGLTGYEERDASTLSGGETQRVALARALITDPDLLLLDEPTANLDPPSTEKIEKFIDELKKEKHITIIMATHNLMQGQRLADNIAILNKKIFQIGKPDEIFQKPKSKFVAEFVGVRNVKKGRSKKLEQYLTLINIGNISLYSTSDLEGDVYVSVRPEDITISQMEVHTSALNQYNGKVKEIKDTGGLINIKIDVGETFTVHMTRKSFLDMKLTIGSSVWLQFKASVVNVFQR